jgi:hypothetical protein
MHVEEFKTTFQAGVANRLRYLKSIGVICLELTPVTGLELDFDWGYGPLHYLAPNQRWGGPPGLKHLVDSCQAKWLAVILDVIFQHVDKPSPTTTSTTTSSGIIGYRWSAGNDLAQCSSTSRCSARHDRPVLVSSRLPRADRRSQQPGAAGPAGRHRRPDDGHRPANYGYVFTAISQWQGIMGLR